MAAFQRCGPTIAIVNTWENGQAGRGELVCHLLRTVSVVVLASRQFLGFLHAFAPAPLPRSWPCSADGPSFTVSVTMRFEDTVAGLRFEARRAPFV